MKKTLYLLCLFSSALHAQSSSILDFINDDNQVTSFASNQVSNNNNQFCDGNLLLDQVPNQSNGIFIDLDCDLCPTGVQVVAENFVLQSNNSLGQFVIYTAYFSGNVPITDIWTLSIHEDNAGEPGNVLYTETNVASTREDTGVDLFGVDEYRVVLSPASAISLNAGIYWVEIHNDSTGSTDNVFWETGGIHANSVTDARWAEEYPAMTWNNEPNEFALQICQEAFDLDVAVTGLAATNSVTVANDKDILVVSSDGTYTLSGVSDGGAYSMTITQQPDTPDQICTVTSGNASGNMTSSGVTIDINCVNLYDVNINVSGLAATNSVSFSNGADNLTISTNGTETISTLADNSAFDVDITTQPNTPNQVCSFTNADTGTLAGADATVNVECIINTYFVGGSVDGLINGNELILDINNVQEIELVYCNGAFVFDTPLDDTSSYTVSVLMDPTEPVQSCDVTMGSGSLNGDDVTDIAVSCEATQDIEYIFREGFDCFPIL